MRKIFLTLLILSFLGVSCQPQQHETSIVTPSSIDETISTPTFPAQSDDTTGPLETATLVPTPTNTNLPLNTSAPSHTPNPTDTPVPVLTPVQTASQAVIIDHTSVALFDQIPDEYLAAARDLKYMFSDRSVGANIDAALNCFTASSWETSPAYCRNDYYDQNWNWKTFPASGSAPARILFAPDPAKYNRDNWIFEARTGGWSELTQDFIQGLAPAYVDKVDALTYQFTYLNVTDRDDIADPNKGFFADNPDRYDIYDLEAYMAQHPDKEFVFWTTSLARGIGTQVSTDFNEQIRQYVREHGLFLLDIADIESHTDQGIPCYDNRDGIEYCSQAGKCENYPDDGVDLPSICQDFTTETDGGHLGSVSGGGIQIAKAFWVLMARVAGWAP
jgi:hypothetical protein